MPGSLPVTINFTPPSDHNITALRIYEAVDQIGPFNMIERTQAVGTYPTYITEYTTQFANSQTDWFSIQWENLAGELTPLATPVRGGVQTYVGEVVKRVLQRDPTLDEVIVTQEAEAVCERYGIDPYSDVTGASYGLLMGLTYIVLARSIVVEAVTTTTGGSGSVQSATMGLVSFKSDTSTTATQRSADALQAMIDLANEYLGVPTSLIFEMEEVTCKYGLSSYDHSRLIAWIGLE